MDQIGGRQTQPSRDIVHAPADRPPETSAPMTLGARDLDQRVAPGTLNTNASRAVATLDGGPNPTSAPAPGISVPPIHAVGAATIAMPDENLWNGPPGLATEFMATSKRPISSERATTNGRRDVPTSIAPPPGSVPLRLEAVQSGPEAPALVSELAPRAKLASSAATTLSPRVPSARIDMPPSDGRATDLPVMLMPASSMPSAAPAPADLTRTLGGAMRLSSPVDDSNGASQMPGRFVELEVSDTAPDSFKASSRSIVGLDQSMPSPQSMAPAIADALAPMPGDGAVPHLSGPAPVAPGELTTIDTLQAALHRDIRAAMKALAVREGAARDGIAGLRTEIELAPEELGRVRLVVRDTMQGAHVQIAVDRPETLDLVRRHVDNLHRALAADGVTLAGVDIGHRDRSRDETGTTGTIEPVEDAPPEISPATVDDAPRMPAGRLDMRF